MPGAALHGAPVATASPCRSRTPSHDQLSPKSMTPPSPAQFLFTGISPPRYHTEKIGGNLSGNTLGATPDLILAGDGGVGVLSRVNGAMAVTRIAALYILVSPRMDDGNLYTRRAALTMVAAAVPAFSQKTEQTPGGPVSNPVVHFEIGCRDRAKSERFYTDLFGWHIQDSGPAAMIDTGGPGAISGHMTALGHEPFHSTMFYVQVDDVQASLDKVTALGGKVVVPPVK